MSELVCIAFKDSSTADRVLNELRAMAKAENFPLTQPATRLAAQPAQ